MPYRLVKGRYRVVNYAPDGDTIRFEPDDRTALGLLLGEARFNAPGHVPLRLEGVDALESHYSPPSGGGALSQPMPLARAATDFLLDFVGVRDVAWTAERRSIASANDGAPGHVLTRSVDKYGRVIAFAFAGPADEEDGDDVFLDATGLAASYNQATLAAGLVYPTFYWGLFADLRNALAATARQARAEGKGVFAGDRTQSGVRVSSLASVTDDAVILPKLFRRLSDFLVATGTVEGFRAALEANREPVLDLTASNFTHFDTFVEQDGDIVRMTRLPEELVFDPMPNRATASLGAMLETASTGRDVRDEAVVVDERTA
ncbi:thermonuclease family protein [Aureimonas leprariae]|uniref:Nuclease n=1 Tax=Plantimonas leprariae TaxID=2615207 RepID=A0A7V7PKE5_9HYPH|nr:nuclease [Aureimonas leprariae]KAB0676285.1 nuclease [Aureimonas leprariae]